MIMKQLIDLRDFCFVWLMKQRGEVYAEQGYKFQLKVLCSGYYIALFTLIAILQYKAAIPVPLIMKGNILAQLIFGLVMLIPYNLFFNHIFGKLSTIPIDKNMGPKKFRLLIRKAILTFLLSIALCALVPWSLDRLLPSFN